MSSQALDDGLIAYDGRRARKDRNNEAVIRAIWDLFAEGEMYPTAQQVADRSGVSLRSVFRHFQNLDALVRCAMDWFLEHNADLLVFSPPPVGATLDDRIDALVQYRLRLYREAGGYLRAAIARSLADPEIAAKVAAHRRYVAGVIDALLAPELTRMGERDRRLAAAAIHLVIQFEGWEMLSIVHGLDGAQIEQWYRAGIGLALEQGQTKRQ